MNPVDNLKETTQLTEQYAMKEYEHAQLKLFYQATSLASSVVKKSLFGVFVLTGLIFISVALALYLGVILDNKALGFLIVGAGYFVMIFIGGLAFRKKIEKYVIQRMAKTYFES